jgi:hypothetical protein
MVGNRRLSTKLILIAKPRANYRVISVTAIFTRFVLGPFRLDKWRIRSRIVAMTRLWSGRAARYGIAVARFRPALPTPGER